MVREAEVAPNPFSLSLAVAQVRASSLPLVSREYHHITLCVWSSSHLKSYHTFGILNFECISKTYLVVVPSLYDFKMDTRKIRTKTPKKPLLPLLPAVHNNVSFVTETKNILVH
jgi:hypothetical protein